MEENQAAARELSRLQGWRLLRSRYGHVVARAISRQDQRWARSGRERKGKVRRHTRAMAGGWNFGLLGSLENKAWELSWERYPTYSCYPWFIDLSCSQGTSVALHWPHPCGHRVVRCSTLQASGSQ